MSKKFSCLERLVTFVLAMVLMLVSASAVYAASDYELSGLGIAVRDTTVYLNTPGSGNTGKVFKSEGVTLLENSKLYYDSGNKAYYKIEYSTSRGSQRGYVYVGDMYRFPNTTTATITQNSNVWYWPDTAKFQTIGTVYNGETVVLLGVNKGWCYIEYNTTSGRKRGYVLSSCVTSANGLTNTIWPPYYETKNLDKAYDVYAGPSRQYVRIGSVSKGELVDIMHSGVDSMYGSTKTQYIAYSVPGQKMKAGYIILAE